MKVGSRSGGGGGDYGVCEGERGISSVEIGVGWRVECLLMRLIFIFIFKNLFS